MASTDEAALHDATDADYEHFVRFFRELDLYDPIPDRQRWASELAPHAFFLDEDGEPAAYGLARVQEAGLGHVIHVVVHADRRGRGTGAALMRAIARRLRAAGCTTWCLNVKRENAPAIHLYERFGLRFAHGSWALWLPWSSVERLPRAERPVHARVLEPSEDEAVERAFGIPRGQLTAARPHGGRVLLRLVDETAPEDPRVGVAAFAPSFPGSFPFQVAHPSLARVLLEAKKGYALPEHDYVRVVVAGDEPLVDTLRAAGARVVYELYHMSGTIPDV